MADLDTAIKCRGIDQPLTVRIAWSFETGEFCELAFEHSSGSLLGELH